MIEIDSYRINLVFWRLLYIIIGNYCEWMHFKQMSLSNLTIYSKIMRVGAMIFLIPKPATLIR
jgi:hypothetical protein